MLHPPLLFGGGGGVKGRRPLFQGLGGEISPPIKGRKPYFFQRVFVMRVKIILHFYIFVLSCYIYDMLDDFLEMFFWFYQFIFYWFS